MIWHHFDIVRALLMAAFGGFASACFWGVGYLKGRRVEQRLTLTILERIRDNELSAIEAAQIYRKIQLEGEPRGLPSRGRR